jgi:hypothetical protein
MATAQPSVAPSTKSPQEEWEVRYRKAAKKYQRREQSPIASAAAVCESCRQLMDVVKDYPSFADIRAGENYRGVTITTTDMLRVLRKRRKYNVHSQDRQKSIVNLIVDHYETLQREHDAVESLRHKFPRWAGWVIAVYGGARLASHALEDFGYVPSGAFGSSASLALVDAAIITIVGASAAYFLRSSLRGR